MPAPTAGQSLLARTAFAVPLIALVAAIAAPRGSVAMFFAISALPVLALLVLDRGWTLADSLKSTLTVALVVFGIYITANAGWAADKSEAFGKTVFFWVLLGAALAANHGITRLDDGALARIGNGLVIGFLLGAAFLVIEVLSDQWLKRQVFTIFPVLRPAPKHIVVTGDTVTDVADYALNRSFAVLMLTIWPALLLLKGRLAIGKAWLATAAILLATAVGVFQSAHETSMLAYLFSGLTFAGFLIAPRLMRPLVIVGWIAATMLVAPIALAAYSAGLHQAKWIPETGRNRIILWNVTATKIREAPLLGTGVASTKFLDLEAAATAEKLPGNTYPQRTGRHAHNVFLQTWYELGAIGAVLLLGIGLAALRSLMRLPANIEPYAIASFVAAALIGAFSWGMWQTWFMAAYGLSAVVLMLAVEGARRVGLVTR